MIQSIYTAASGISGEQSKIDSIAANIANINTTGYKGSRMSFKDAYYTMLENPEGGGGENLARGTGVRSASTDMNLAQGNIADTGNNLDFAISGNGFFTLRDNEGNIRYTRNGSFSISVEQTGNYLTADDGAYVLDSDGQRIEMPKDGSEISVADDGAISFKDGKNVKLGISEFSDPAGLLRVGESRFAVTGASGAAEKAAGFKLRQGALEGSNVELADEITDLMQSQRLFSLAGKALQTADEMEGLANNIRR